MLQKSCRGRPAQQAHPHPDLEPEISWGRWARLLLPQEQALYACLHEAALNGRRLGLRPIRRALGTTYVRNLDQVFVSLEELGFIKTGNWGKVIPMDVYVNPVPPAPDAQTQAKLQLRRFRQTGNVGDIAEFLNYYKEWYRRRCHTEYPLVRGKDWGIARNLLNTYSLQQLKSLVAHFFKYQPPPYTLVSFAARKEEIARRHAHFQATMVE